MWSNAPRKSPSVTPQPANSEGFLFGEENADLPIWQFEHYGADST
jgi:hypothetical protein